MNPDHKAALRQLDAHAQALATDLESVRLSPGVDAHEIRIAEYLLKTLVKRAANAIRGNHEPR